MQEEYVSNYCHATAVRLEEKVRELAEANEGLAKIRSELERRVAERTAQLDAASRELDEFGYSVSHDLRAPLRHIDGFSQALADDHAEKLDKMGKEYLDRIRKSAKRMIEMMDALLQLSRFSRGALVKESVDLSAMARDVFAELARSQPERKVTSEIAAGMVAEGDPRLLKVVLEHLIGNAWKFSSEKEEAVVEIFATQLDGRPAFAVRDNGAGFDPGYTEKLFSPFQRLHAVQEFPGLGVGLATVKKIVTRHGGKVRAEADLGKGATFTFTLN